jgi:hypothetical protein
MLFKQGDVMHPSEPSMEELKRLRRELYAAESTDENVKKVEAIEHQISRRELETTAGK